MKIEIKDLDLYYGDHQALKGIKMAIKELYPFAIILHTGMDFIGALSIFNVINLSAWTLEGIVAVFGLLTFFGAYLLLYRKDV